MVSDEQVQDLLKYLPEGSFIREFCSYGHYVCDAADVYFFGAALTVVSGVIDSEVTGYLGQQLSASLWTLIIGESGSRKTVAAGKAFKLLQEIDSSLVGDDHESEASLLESLAQKPQQLVFHGEFGKFLAGTREGSYKSSLREAYMSLWDGTRVSKQKLGHSVVVDNPRVSLLCCAAPSMIEKHTSEEAWTGGFFSRFLLFVGESTRRMTPPPTFPEKKEWLAKKLDSIRQMPVRAPDGMTDDAATYLRTADQAWLLAQQKAEDRWVAGINNRLATTALKVALVIACDGGSATQAKGGPWKIGLSDIVAGVAVAQMVAQSVEWVLRSLALTPFARDIRAVKATLRDNEQDLGALLLAVRPRMSKSAMLKVLETLVETGEAKKESLGEGVPDTYAQGKAKAIVGFGELCDDSGEAVPVVSPEDRPEAGDGPGWVF